MNNGYVKDCDGYTIQTLTAIYIKKLMSLFALYISPDNLLAYSYDFIKKQFYDENKSVYNFLIAIDKSDDSVIGAIGFVDTSFYDANAIENFVWFTNWLSVKTTYRTVGINLLYCMFSYKSGSTFGTTGNNEVAGAIYKKLGFVAGSLTQYYMVNDKVIDCQLIKNFDLVKKNIKDCDKMRREEYTLRQYRESDFENIKKGFPDKSMMYMKRKYAENPFYKYNILTIQRMGIEIGMLFIKTDTYQGTKALRIVDFIGDAECFAHINVALQSLLKEKNAEYIDCYCYGIDNDIFMDGGFLQNDMQNGLVVPCYFEPFHQINVIIRFSYQKNQSFTIFKGDGDRDFPRIWSR